jgi:hypothetical protein
MANPPDAASPDAGNRDIVDAFRQSVEPLWEGVVSLIGETSAVAMFHSALQEATRRCSLLEGIDVDRTGVRVDRLRVNVRGVPRATLCQGLLAYVQALEGLLRDLTGHVVLRKVEPFVQQLKHQLGRE